MKTESQEVDYRIAKWIIRNMEKEQLLSPDEIRSVWGELLSFYSPPNKSIENVSGSIRGRQLEEHDSLLPFRRKTICSACGNFFSHQVWHNTDPVWKCWGRCGTRDICLVGIHLYEYAFAYPSTLASSVNNE